MNYAAGICPKCHEYLLLKQNLPFVVCPMCGESISNQEAVSILSQRAAKIDNVNDLIADCIALEIQYGPELPFLILDEIVRHFPHLESPAYLETKMTGYELGTMRMYLTAFSGVKSQPENVPWAEEFLDACMTYRHMDMADLFASYIHNKIRPDKQKDYLEKLQKLKQEYTFKASDPNSTKWLMALYLGGSIVNVLLFPIFMLLSGWLSTLSNLYFAANIALGLAVIGAEMGLMYWHHKIYGNRLNMSQKERIFMVIFLSSIVFVVGSTVMGSIWKIRL